MLNPSYIKAFGKRILERWSLDSTYNHKFSERKPAEAAWKNGALKKKQEICDDLVRIDARIDELKRAKLPSSTNESTQTKKISRSLKDIDTKLDEATSHIRASQSDLRARRDDIEELHQLEDMKDSLTDALKDAHTELVELYNYERGKIKEDLRELIKSPGNVKISAAIAKLFRQFVAGEDEAVIRRDCSIIISQVFKDQGETVFDAPSPKSDEKDWVDTRNLAEKVTDAIEFGINELVADGSAQEKYLLLAKDLKDCLLSKAFQSAKDLVKSEKVTHKSIQAICDWAQTEETSGGESPFKHQIEKAILCSAVSEFFKVPAERKRAMEQQFIEPLRHIMPSLEDALSANGSAQPALAAPIPLKALETQPDAIEDQEGMPHLEYFDGTRVPDSPSGTLEVPKKDPSDSQDTHLNHDPMDQEVPDEPVVQTPPATLSKPRTDNYEAKEAHLPPLPPPVSSPTRTVKNQSDDDTARVDDIN